MIDCLVDVVLERQPVLGCWDPKAWGLPSRGNVVPFR